MANRAVDDQANATGRANPGAWNTLTFRTVYRDGLTGTDATVTGITESIDLRKSRIGYSNAIYAFIQLLGGASSVTLSLFINAMDPLPRATPVIAPVGDDNDWCLVESTGALTVNTVFRFPSATPDLSAGLYKIQVTAITPGAGTVRISEAHTEG